MIHYTEFQGKRVLVTGANSGIGEAQAKKFLEQGAVVIGIDQNSDAMKRLKRAHAAFQYYQIDICDSGELEQTVTAILAEDPRLDYLINTAGILDDYLPTLETSAALWQRVIATNLTAVFHLTNLILPSMLERKKGTIINTASIAGKVAGGGGAAYTTAKHGLIGYTKQLALDYGQMGIHVNALAPGAIQTPMNAADFAGAGEMAKWVAEETPLKRWAKPEEVAELTLFLASEAAGYIQGAVVPIDGGWLLK